jgi:membrane-associated phospholipid phosphatase
MKRITKLIWLVLLTLGCNFAATARADEISDWNKIIFQTVRVAPATPVLEVSRVAAMVHAAVFDAVNGIKPRFTYIYVEPAARKKASRRAAAVQAAYAVLLKLYPGQKSNLDEKRAASLAAIANDETSVAIDRGIEWGQEVADAVVQRRSTDGFAPTPPPFMGGSAIGQWRPTPTGFAPGAGPQFAYMTPWVMRSTSQFRPAGPPDLNSERYTAEFNETKNMGSASSASRTSDQTVFSLFWASASTNYFWNSVAVSLSAEHPTTLIQNARLFALLNIAIADAAIGCWDAKYYYTFWRPITAIRLASDDGNVMTEAESNWTPLRPTPAHPEYPSGHSALSGAAATILADYFGEETAFTVDSDGMPDVVRSFSSFSAALDEISNARVFAGIHFRSACDDGRATGIAIGKYAIANSFQRIR